MPEFLDWLNAHAPAHDKALHFIAGTLLSFASIWLTIWVSVPFVLAVAVGKELWDHRNPPHTADALDAVAVVLGALPVWLVAVLHG